MNNLLNKQCAAITAAYGLTSDNRNYALIFSAKTTMYGLQQYNSSQIIFRLIHADSFSSSLIKEYSLTTTYDGNNHIIKFTDLNPGTRGIQCVYVLNNSDNTASVYVKGKNEGAKVKLQIIYSTNPSLFKFYNASKFNIDITSLTYVTPATNDIINSYDSLSDKTIKVTYSNDAQYIHIATVKPYLNDWGFALQLSVCESPTSTLAGQSATFYVVASISDTSVIKGSKNIQNDSSVTKQLNLIVAQDESGNINLYIQSSGNGTLIIRPIMYDNNSESCKIKFQSLTSIPTVPGTILKTI